MANTPDFNQFLASMTNNGELSNLMNNLSSSLQQETQSNNNNNSKKQNDNNSNKNSSDTDDDDDDDEFDQLLYTLLTNENEEPFPHILDRIDKNISNLSDEMKKHNSFMEKICEHLVNNK